MFSLQRRCVSTGCCLSSERPRLLAENSLRRFNDNLSLNCETFRPKSLHYKCFLSFSFFTSFKSIFYITLLQFIINIDLVILLTFLPRCKNFGLGYFCQLIAYWYFKPFSIVKLKVSGSVLINLHIAEVFSKVFIWKVIT